MMITIMMNSRSVQRRRRPLPLVAVGLLLLCFVSTRYEHCTFAFSIPPNSKAMHKTMDCHHPSLLVRFAAPIKDGDDTMGNAEQPLLDPATGSQIILDNSSSSRRSVITAITSTIITASTTILSAPQSARADVTNKVASTTALRTLTNLQTQLPLRLKPVAQSNNYVGIKQCLREPPLDGIRKNMLVLVRGGEDGPKAGELLLAYKQSILALENIDATATLGMQGRTKKLKDDPFLLSLQYDEVEKALALFIEVGSAAASIPLQEDDGKQTKVGSIDVRSGEVTPRDV
mmetsp:Transcript_11931/g.18308  ORF Transcript_11931/g.18308 Transcript_11931/m.18308 type:complete len:288 (+) Transcript_11931:17-880(+)